MEGKTEIHSIAARGGVQLKDSIVADTLEKASKFPYDLKTSL
jgi:hypothetical protein